MVERTRRGLRLRVHAQPRSRFDRVAGRYGDALKVQVTAPPVEGAANAAVLAVVAGWLGVPRGSVAMLTGRTGRSKVVEIATADPAGLAARVEALLQTSSD